MFKKDGGKERDQKGKKRMWREGKGGEKINKKKWKERVRKKEKKMIK